MSQYGFYFDKDKCVGCRACEVACQIWNDSDQTVKWRNVTAVIQGTYPQLGSANTSLACNHCGDAPCKIACPRSAITKDSETGQITVDQERCVGCMFCLWACPFAAPQLGALGKMEKCNFCEDRPMGMKKACEEICPNNAIVSGEVEEISTLHDQGVLFGHE
jgi:Fe-S-cluster-containing dehydrogenase component